MLSIHSSTEVLTSSSHYTTFYSSFYSQLGDDGKVGHLVFVAKEFVKFIPTGSWQNIQPVFIFITCKVIKEWEANLQI